MKMSSGMASSKLGSNTSTPSFSSSWQNLAISSLYRFDPQTTTDFIIPLDANWRRRPELNRYKKVLQTFALPFRHGANKQLLYYNCIFASLQGNVKTCQPKIEMSYPLPNRNVRFWGL